MLSGDNGLLQKAVDSKEKTVQAQKDEAERISEYENVTNDYTSGGSYGEILTKQADGTFKDSNNNEWVWIEVPQTVAVYATTGLGRTTFSNDDLKTIRADLLAYTGTILPDGDNSKTTRNGYKDEWYDWDAASWDKTASVDPLLTEDELATLNLSNDVLGSEAGCGLTYTKYKEKYEAMLKSVYQNGGFYIGKYETGYKFAEETELIRTDEGETIQKPVIQANAYPYNYVTVAQAEKLAEGNDIAVSGKTTSLMFGVQWDLVLKYLNEKGNLSVTDLTVNSTKWGNYTNNNTSEYTSFTITSGSAKKSEDYGKTWSAIAKDTVKSNMTFLLTTGSSSNLAPLNIYDLAGNLYEWTLECSHITYYPCVKRAGYSYFFGSDYPASIREYWYPTNSNYNYGFRVSLY